jgi:hypothetical protein
MLSRLISSALRSVDDPGSEAMSTDCLIAVTEISLSESTVSATSIALDDRADSKTMIDRGIEYLLNVIAPIITMIQIYGSNCNRAITICSDFFIATLIL